MKQIFEVPDTNTLKLRNVFKTRTRYPWMVKTYLDQRWHNGRKQKFYHNLEQQQKFTQQERKLNKLEKQKQKDYAFSRLNEYI